MPEKQQTVTIQQALELAVQHHTAGRLSEAETIYQQLLHSDPNQPVALNLLGVIAHQTEKNELAVDLITKSLIIRPDYAEAHYHLGLALKELGRLHEAVEHFKEATRLHSKYAGVYQQSIWEIEQISGMHGDYSSQAGQDKFIGETLFKEKTNGIFVEIGGYDGVTGSNTLFFEKFWQWSGICIEPTPAHFEKMIRSRTVECLNVAISNYEGEDSFLEITKGRCQMGGLIADLRPGFLNQLKEGKGTECREIHVPVSTFGTIAKERNLRHVDYCSIDTEGTELKILYGIDFDFTNITVISVENPNHLSDNYKLIRSFMNDHGYRLVATIGSDDIFKK